MIVEIAEVLTQLVTREDFNKFVVETAKANNGRVYYEQVFKQFPEIMPLFQNTIIGRRSNSLRTNEGDTYDFVRNDIAYQTMIFVPNEAVARPSDRSIVSPEIQIYRETGEGDIYFAWDVKKDKPKKEINIVEKEAMATTVPVIATSLRHVAFLKPYKLKENQPNITWKFRKSETKPLSTRGAYDAHVYIRRANLLYNYDGGTSSELWFTGSFISDNGSEFNWVRLGGSTTWQASDHNQTCNLMGTNDDNRYTTFNHNGNNANFWVDKKYFVNAYERDWGSSNKPLGTAVYAGRTATYEGRRKYTDEWYLFHPARQQSHVDGVPMSFLFNNIGSPAYPTPDPDPNAPNNDCASTSPYKNSGLKIDLEFTRGWY